MPEEISKDPLLDEHYNWFFQDDVFAARRGKISHTKGVLKMGSFIRSFPEFKMAKYVII